MEEKKSPFSLSRGHRSTHSVSSNTSQTSNTLFDRMRRFNKSPDERRSYGGTTSLPEDVPPRPASARSDSSASPQMLPLTAAPLSSSPGSSSSLLESPTALKNRRRKGEPCKNEIFILNLRLSSFQIH